MAKFHRCDACGKESADEHRRSLDPAFIWIDVEANEDIDHFDACSWACVAELALSKAARDAVNHESPDQDQQDRRAP